MSHRRDTIRMSDAELTAYLQEQRVVTVGTIGANGRPHLVPLWYVPHGHTLEAWTYAKSTKVPNLDRDPRATLLVESGDTYDQLRGAMLECDVAVIRDPDEVARIGFDLTLRYADGPLDDAAHDAVKAFTAQQAAKRVGLRATPTRIVTWDHRKLGGRY